MLLVPRANSAPASSPVLIIIFLFKNNIINFVELLLLLFELGKFNQEPKPRKFGSVSVPCSKEPEPDPFKSIDSSVPRFL